MWSAAFFLTDFWLCDELFLGKVPKCWLLNISAFLYCFSVNITIVTYMKKFSGIVIYLQSRWRLNVFSLLRNRLSALLTHIPEVISLYLPLLVRRWYSKTTEQIFKNWILPSAERKNPFFSLISSDSKQDRIKIIGFRFLHQRKALQISSYSPSTLMTIVFSLFPLQSNTLNLPLRCLLEQLRSAAQATQ